MKRRVDILIAPDRHAPFHSKPACAAFLKFARAERPRMILDLGDGGDAYGLSRFAKKLDLLLEGRARHELPAMGDFLRACVKIAPTTTLRSNHPDRWAKLLQDFPGADDFPNPYRAVVEQAGARYYPHSFLKLGPRLLACHGDEGGMPSRAVAKARRTGMSIIQGHSHRLLLEWLSEDWFAVEAGHLLDPRKGVFEYSAGADSGVNGWCSGFPWLDSEGIPHVERL